MKWTVCFSLLLSAVCASAQLPTDFRSEQIFLGTDRHEYMPGDTVEVEGRGLHVGTGLEAVQQIPVCGAFQRSRFRAGAAEAVVQGERIFPRTAGYGL